jgi:hypothetical protein
MPAAFLFLIYFLAAGSKEFIGKKGSETIPELVRTK